MRGVGYRMAYACVAMIVSGTNHAAGSGTQILRSPNPTDQRLTTSSRMASPAPVLNEVQLHDSVNHAQATSITYRRRVLLQFALGRGGAATEARISERSDFSDSAWRPLTANASYRFAEDTEGMKTVYAQVRAADDGIPSAVRQDSIHYAKTPTLTVVSINNGNANTADRNVTVRWQHTGTATQYRIGNSPNMAGASWKTGGSAPPQGVPHTLAEGAAGIRTVFVQLRNGSSPETTASDTINVTTGLCPIGHRGQVCSGAGNCLPSGQCQCNADIEGPACTIVCQRCYGANGNNCGAADGINFGFCVGNQCLINAGSWAHDECCIRHRWGGPASQQGSCSPPPFGSEPRYCQTEFAKAATHLPNPQLTWKRTVNTSKRTCSDQVNMPVLHADMCNPRGGTLLCSDVKYCCSRNGKEVVVQAPLTTGGKLCVCD